MLQCPRCGSVDVYRSKRNTFERTFNWLFWYHQRPYQCSSCLTRFWARLDHRVWRHAMKSHVMRHARGWGVYLGALILTAVVAWTVNYLHTKSQDGNPLFDAALKQGVMQKLNESNLSPEQKKAAEEYFKKSQQGQKPVSP